MFVALTTDLQSSIASKVNLFVALAPITRLANQKISTLNEISQYYSLLQTAINSLGIYEIGGPQLDNVKSSICQVPFICRILNAFQPKGSQYNDPDRITWIRNRPFAGASVRELTHYA